MPAVTGLHLQANLSPSSMTFCHLTGSVHQPVVLLALHPTYNSIKLMTVAVGEQKDQIYCQG